MVIDPDCTNPPTYQSGDKNTDNQLQQGEIWTYTCLHKVTKAEVDASGLITDTAHLSGGNGTLGGTITFDVFAPGDTTCAKPLSPAPASAIVTGVGNYSSGAFMATSTGNYRWIAHYSGDADNNPVSTSCYDPDETSTVNPAKLKLTTTASGPVTLGNDIMDTAHLSGGVGTLSGTITFDVFAPGDVTCAVPLTPAPAGAIVKGVGDYTSGGFAAPVAGSYRWIAHYSGGASNDPVSTSCNDPDETSAVNATSAENGGNSGNAGNTASLPSNLPRTGFAPNRVTSLPSQSIRYTDLGDLWLEIPRLGVKMPIVGVPQSGSGWDVSWLGSQAGWLNGTAFPSTAGDSVLTGHVYDALGQRGPFVHLNWLWYGDQIIIHASGTQYVYEVRQVLQVAPNAVLSVIKHEELPWITLITCRGSDEASNSYKYRVAVKAVLVEEK
jgi:LPXTG-site transpeptidase (sortase) family protein